MRVLFAASPAIALPSLEALYNIEGIELAGVLTNPDTPKGRHGNPQPTDIGSAVQNVTPVFKPEKLDALAREQVNALHCDLLVSFAYGKIFGPKFLALFPLGGINIHPSLLPKYRGPTPIQAAILNRDTVTGITIQKLALQMDKGAILAQEKLQLTGKETAGSLSEIAAAKAAVMLPSVLIKIADGKLLQEAQEQNDSEAVYCSLISKEDGIIDWNKSAPEIEAKIRAYDPSPFCRTIHNGRELIILKADIFKTSEKSQNNPGQVLGIDKIHGILIQTGDGILAVTQLQYQAKKALFWRDFLNGARDFSGSLLG
ncbi:MAG: methionyl-tRNA formyltransferase [Treponema sp.]|nr:methionyl-tRNA formyltransferase [Treponema sp.]MCL2251236.1 methionyl-tRNA formyltransferase [Treponema sp.]